jgi:hypothetical protein
MKALANRLRRNLPPIPIKIRIQEIKWSKSNLIPKKFKK